MWYVKNVLLTFRVSTFVNVIWTALLNMYHISYIDYVCSKVVLIRDRTDIVRVYCGEDIGSIVFVKAEIT